MPPRMSAIVMLDRPGNTLSAALRVARQHRAPFLVISHAPVRLPLPGPAAASETDLLNPRPAMTQGKAEFVGRLARKYHWQSIAVVTITPQASHARLRVERCFAGPVYVVATPIAPTSWPYEIAYEWGAMINALVLQRGC